MNGGLELLNHTFERCIQQVNKLLFYGCKKETVTVIIIIIIIVIIIIIITIIVVVILV